MSTLVFLEHHEGKLEKDSLGVLSKAASLGGEVEAALLGFRVEDLAAEAGRYGAARVYVADDELLAAPLPQPRVDVLEALVRERGYDWTSEPRLALIRSGTFEPAEVGGSAEVERFESRFQDFSLAARMIEQAHEESEGPSIEDANVIVAGGRGLGGPESFALVEELAKALGGAVAATRAVVDAGWYPYAAQVGQTGKTVSPKLYVACGISGAIQHKVGMQSSGVIVAINKDPNAPIFEYADLGVVGDLHEILPKLTELVRRRKAA